MTNTKAYVEDFVREFPETRQLAAEMVDRMLRMAFTEGASSTLDSPDVEVLIKERVEKAIRERTWRLRSAKDDLLSLGGQFASLQHGVKRLNESVTEFIANVDKLPDAGNA